MGQALEDGISKLRWNSDEKEKNTFISQAMKIVTEVDVLVKKMKDNVSKMQSLMDTWSKPLFDRKKTAESEIVAQYHAASVQPRQDDIRAQGKEIHKLLRDTMDNIKPDKKGYVWLQYVDYVNGLIIEGITSAINSSMQYLSDQINIKLNVTNMWAPIFDIKVDLLDDELSFQPAIGCNDRQTGIRDIINEFVNDFISIAIQIQRVDNKEAAAGDYLVEIKDQFQLFGTMQEISNHLDEITSKGSSFLDQYRQWDFLWKEEVETSFQDFLLQGTDLKDIYVKECTSKYMSDDTEEMDNNMRNAMDRYSYLEKKVFDGVTTRAPDL
jgi:dynein heavy chain